MILFDEIWLLLLCLAFWLIVFFCFLGPLIVWFTGEESSPENSPTHHYYNTSFVSKTNTIKRRVQQQIMNKRLSASQDEKFECKENAQEINKLELVKDLVFY